MPAPSIQEETERIYVGGMDPRLLSVKDVYHRLEGELKSSSGWELDQVHMGSCYFQVNARKQKSRGEDTGSESEASPSNSALEQARSLFHNVKWKGCKLRVEKAQPHFLERLAQEQKDKHGAQPTVEASEKSMMNQPIGETNPPQQKRRHYKIRRGYGQTVFHVDTKPYEVEDFSNFSKLKYKLKRRKLQQEQLIKTSNSTGKNENMQSPNKKQKQQALAIARLKAKNNRAIHLRFLPGTGNSDVPASKILFKKEKSTRKEDEKSNHIESGDESSPDSSMSEKEKQSQQKHEQYQWSSDEESSSDDSAQNYVAREMQAQKESDSTDSSCISEESDNDDIGTKVDASTRKQTQENIDRRVENNVDSANESSSAVSSESVRSYHDVLEVPSLAKQSLDGSSDVEDLTITNPEKNLREGSTEAEQEKKKPQGAKTGNDDSSESEEDFKNAKNNHQEELCTKEYEWSSNEDSLANENEILPVEKAGNSISAMKEKWNPMDEFAMGELVAESIMVATETSADQSSVGSHVDLDMKQEERTNMNVLAKLFPEFEKPVSKPDKDESDEDGEKEKEEKQQLQNRSGWAASGQMLRFDPSKVSAQQFIIERNEDEDQKGEEEIQSDENNKDKVALQQPPEPKKDNNSIYQQGELESVFREAREAETTKVRVVESIDQAQEESGFSFSFNVGNSADAPLPTPEDSSQGFPFAFSVSGEMKGQGQDSESHMSHGNSKTTEMYNDDGGGMESSVPDSAAVRRRGFGFPEEDLDQYVRDFFEFDDGKRMLEDLEGYRKDPEVRNHWEEERKALTQDWKRKRKAAVARRSHGHFQRHRNHQTGRGRS
eukprot:CAMPEP_0172455524 /NCGR_PEP_ID=MMETSP1065-20121228/12108_1 /TAXON_ID=265537 /ORGANISM="Amphiprora paludosa, Strain CCMP125" /LENGTH=832 /DNA_ID=CAMNT_0013207987 /DNA_START=64 /DNA_END=2562 /DNA_ORIENTATION=+